MRTNWAIAGAMAVLLGACGSKTVTADNASTAEVAAKVKASGVIDEKFISPGHWQSTMTINDMKMPGMPPEMESHVKMAMGKPRTFDSCVTPEQAKKPKADFFSGKDAGHCRYDHFAMGAGVIDMTMSCTEQGMKRTVKMNGTYGSDAYHMTILSSGAGGKSPADSMTMNATMDAKRIGACTGKETP